MGPLRIGIDYRPALLQSSGIGRAVRELARALGAAGIGIDLRLFGHSLARARRDDAATAASDAAGLAGSPHPAPNRARLHRLPIPGRALGALARIGLGADRLSGGVALFHWTDYVHPPISPRTAAVLTVHDVAFAEDPSSHGTAQSKILLERTRRAAARASRVIVPTAATARAAAEHLGIDEDRLRVVPFGADHLLRCGDRGDPARNGSEPAPAPLHPFGGRPFVLSLGTVEPRKNHLRLLEAHRALGADRPLLVVVGRRGWECDAIVRALDDASGGSQSHRRTDNRTVNRTVNRGDRHGDVVWLESADDRTVRACLTHAELLAYPSLLEGFGFPPLEALSCGTPVVAGDTPALREVLGDGARFCDPTSVDAIHAAIAAVLSDPELRAAIVDAGRRRVAELRWSDCAARHAGIYREVAT